MIGIVDVFAGCGGLSEGFSRLNRNGTFPFDVRLHIEKEKAPIRTLHLRTFYHQFRESETPDSYYAYVRGQIDREDLFRNHPAEASEAERRCLQVELGNPETDAEMVNQRIREAIRETGDWVLIGGPPCQAYSVIGRSRNQGKADYDLSTDHRTLLYKEYLSIIAGHRPAVFVMENVRGLLSASHHNKSVFQQMIQDLLEPGYRIYHLTNGKMHLGDDDSPSNPAEFVVKTEEYGIPQARHRIVILGVRNDISTRPEPLTLGHKVTSAEVLNDLPRVRSGLSFSDGPAEWIASVHEITLQDWWRDVEATIQRRICEALENLESPDSGRGGLFVNRPPTGGWYPGWFLDERLSGTLNHQARTHRKDDLWRYLYASCVVKESARPFHIRDFPPGLRPGHRNIESSLENGTFTDRFCLVREHEPSKTVVSHISKDGHYYIHYAPTQCRSLTVREAARLQTFPDNYFFEGNRTDQYKQVGNAVPPLLSLQIADRVAQLLEEERNGYSHA